ncbi:Telomere length regulator protein rif1 [Colletotrichum trifolii]|uniref:Telomere length regulator protein rif1 n=1 Tax=Colletotrichum trifolii TaxID=5466 RepID=A0A4R8RM72_COLTR|nr:Telomere length regulator protein rif1 [Colletotrichum trifolii]
MGSVEVELLSSRLESLPPRPPTPPRETSQAADAASKLLLVLPPSSDPRSSLHTPPSAHTPVSGADSTNPSGPTGRKRVGFSAQAHYKDAPRYHGVDSASMRSPLSAPSSAQPKPVKGILKQPSSPSPVVNDDDDPLVTAANIADMLESTVKQLAGADRDSKRDAYTTLVMTLKTSNNLPDRIALQGKMGLFVQFIQRDITSRSPATGGLDVPLVNNALSLLATFLHFPAIASTIPGDFGVFFVDHCIRCFEDPSTPKDVARHLMHAMATQDFSPKVMTSDRVKRLVAALRQVEDHLKGKSIVMSRIFIYKRLVQQSKQLMVVHSDWLNDLLADMLSTIKDLRSAAISLGFEAVYTFGKEKSLSRKVMELFDTSVEEMKFAEYYHRRLFAMAKDREDRQLTASVPKIWSVIILFLRCPLERWQFFNQWLQIIQMCFNNNEHPQTKQEANLAWNRFVWSMHTEGPSFAKLLPTLYQPLGSQLKSKYTSKQMREVVFGSVCNLLYYAFKPGTNASLLETYWDACVKPITEPPKSPARDPDAIDEHMRQATAVLTGLFDSSTPRIWKEERIRDTTLARPTELPAIDPKWLRRNAALVFQVMGPIMDRYFLELADETSHVHKLWRALVGAVASASSKDIKVSPDTLAFISQMCGLLLKHWKAGLDSTGHSDSEDAARFLKSARELVSSTVEAVGILPFTERMICLGRLDTFAPASTPSHKPGRNAGDTRTPLYHLFGMFSRLPPGIPDDEGFVGFFRSVISPFFTPKSPRARSDLAQEILSITPSWPSPVAHAPYAPWVFASDCLAAAFNSSQNSAQTNSSTAVPGLGHEYRAVVRLLERGLKENPNLPWEHWSSLFSFLSNRSSEETGEAGRALGAIEPLAKIMRDVLPADRAAPLSSMLISGAAGLLSVAHHPIDKQAVEAARRRLWGTAVTGSRTSSFDPFDNLYKLSNDVLERLYDTVDSGHIDGSVAIIINEVIAFLSRCNSELVSKTLYGLEGGLAVWIRDAQGKVDTRQSPVTSEAIQKLWAVVARLTLSGEKPEEIYLETAEELLCAAFESKHRHIVNSVSERWNRIFENTRNTGNMQYPEHLKAVLLSIQSMVDIVLPGLENASVVSTGQNRSFVESQEDLDMHSVTSTRPSRRRMNPSAASNQSSPLSSIKSSRPASRQLGRATPGTRAKGQRGGVPAARLRHEDSQIQFEPIEKSPLNPNTDAESQVLTERQKEIRERQKDTSAMFPEMRSSPPADFRSGPANTVLPTEKAPETPQESTPKRSTMYEEYVSSTPTPRRGQTLAMADNDQDMTDPPSSPPEPRPFPLLTQIKSRSSSRSELENWQFSSSPVSGTPPAEETTAAREPTEINISSVVPSQKEARQPSPDLASAVDDSFQMISSNAVTEPELPPPAYDSANQHHQLPQQVMGDPAKLPKEAGHTPSTPQNNRIIDMEEPRSGQEVFVDAPSSPQPNVLTRSASRIAATNRSFEMSDGDENSMIRLVVELDRRRCDIPINDYPAISPPKPSKAPMPAAEEAEVLDCITVRGDDDDEDEEEDDQNDNAEEEAPAAPVVSHSQRELRTRSSKSISPAKQKSSVPSSVQSTPSKSAKNKRKRATSYDTRRKKRKSVDSSDENEYSWPQEASIMSPILGNDRENQPPSVLDTPSRRSVASKSDDVEAEVQSQLEIEQQAADIRLSQSQPDIDGDADDALSEVMDVDNAVETEISESVSKLKAATTGAFEQTKRIDLMDSLSDVLANLRSASLSRDEVNKMEDVLMDIKRELYSAEHRGRH